MININGKEYRNIQEQVEKNQEDIKEIKESTIDAYSKAEADDKFETISDVYGNFYTRDQSDARFPTETHMNLLLGYKQDTLTAGTNITIDSNNVISALENPATVQLTFTFSGGTTQTYDVVIKPSNNS